MPERDKIDLALADGNRLGLAVSAYASGRWTVIEELSGGVTVRSAETWLELAQGRDLVYAAYDDTVPYAEVVVVETAGRCGTLQEEQDSSADLDVGRSPKRQRSPLRIGSMQ